MADASTASEQERRHPADRLKNDLTKRQTNSRESLKNLESHNEHCEWVSCRENRRWNGALLDSIDTVLRFAATMPWQGTHPFVTLVTTTYQTGVTLTKEAMEAVEAQIKRLPHLGKWFVDIVPAPPPLWDP